ncbi:preprotein translocase subunit SecE [uncultured Campylobacter sp.]|uniref:preprotein translocase subunit SecE n=1 Tax=uncultured Campylobacter sp. TaxID=218934 RepID=UPI00262971F5|nr:preprotein translocase subunit SecE [uncultured Campylobacter sp.]
MEKLLSYFRLSKAELSKVIFPLREQVRNAYITVFVVVFVVALFLWIVDLIMFYSLSFIVS